MAKAKNKKQPSVFDKPPTFAGTQEQAIAPAAVKAGSRKKADPPFAAGKGNTPVKK